MSKYGEYLKSKIKTGAKSIGSGLVKSGKATYGLAKAEIGKEITKRKETRKIYKEAYDKEMINQLRKQAKTKAREKMTGNAKNKKKPQDLNKLLWG